jgi:cathepsin L
VFRNVAAWGFDGNTFLLNGNETALKELIKKNGPIAVGVYATPNMFYYKSGILIDPLCPNNAFNHFVLAVGYGTENGKDYW